MKSFYAAKYESAWYFFLAVVFVPALIVSTNASELSVSETYQYALAYIGNNTFAWLGYLLYLPVGTIACLLPSDTQGLMIFPHMIFGDFAIYMFWLLIVTTYPPFYRGPSLKERLTAAKA